MVLVGLSKVLKIKNTVAEARNLPTTKETNTGRILLS